MNKLNLSLLLTAVLCAAVSAAPIVTLPDKDAYTYWFRTSGGSVSQKTYESRGTGTINISKEATSGGTLYILDQHTGNIASIPLSTASKGVSVTIDDFKSTAAPSSTSTQPGTPSMVKPGSGSNGAAPESSDAGPSLLSRIVSWIIGAAVLTGVLWFVRMLILAKGQPLIDIARKVGVEVPNPDDLPKMEKEHDGKYEPPPVVRVEKIPESATKPARQASAHGYLIADNGTSYGIGSKPVSIGRVEENDITLADSSVSRKHARIESSGGAVELFDEGSANGVYVNGQRVTRQTLTAGDRILIGKVALRFEK